MEKVNTVYLSIGSNLGDRLANLQGAIDNLKKKCRIVQISAVYETDAEGFESTYRFYNAALHIETKLEPLELLAYLKQTEQLLGRNKPQKSQGYQSRTIDLDIVFFNDQTLTTSELILPHPRYHERLFVLWPLREVISTENTERLKLIEFYISKVQDHKSIDKTLFSLIH
jgi:2-amino-4-hydroxy-6-hydroxymethyldihydropteridine diphosphokinase